MALSAICGEEDTITQMNKKYTDKRKVFAGVDAQNYHVPLKHYSLLDYAKAIIQQKKRIFYNHISAKEVKRYTDKSVWNSYFKFCFERNPWDKVISAYWFDTGGRIPINEYLCSEKCLKTAYNFRRYTEQEEVIVDKVFKYENLEAALSEISKKLQLEQALQLPKEKARSNNRKNRQHYSEILGAADIEYIASIFWKEIEYNNYTF